MKKIFAITFLALSLIFLSSLAFAAKCELEASIINQDPYPATPGDYVKVVFQITGVQDPQCGDITAQIVPSYPFSLDEGATDTVSIKAGTFSSTDFNSYLLVPFKLRVDPNALEGSSTIRLKYGNNYGGAPTTFLVKDFDISINNTKTDLEVFVNSYSYATKTLTLQVVNVGKNNIESTIVEIPNQDGITLEGSNQKVIGSLNSNDDTTINFNMGVSNLKDNELKVNIRYNDPTNTRRSLDKTILLDPKAFESTKAKSSSLTISFYLLILTWILIIVYYFYKKRKDKRKRKLDLLRKG